MTDKNNYSARVTYQGGKDSYEFPFSYLRRDFIKAQIDLSESESNTLAYMVDYTIDGQTLKLTKPVDADKTITIYRETSSKPLVEYEDSSILRAYDLNLSQCQNLNIIEEQTDSILKNYSLTQDTKDYMYKNLMDTKTAIDNKMSETLGTVDSKLTTAQADVKKAVSDMNASLDETKQFVISSVSTMNDTVNTTKKSVEDSLATTTTNLNDAINTTKKSVEDSLAEMNTTVANTKKSVEDSLATTTTNLNDAINTATSSMDSKITQASQELEEAKADLETTKRDIEKALVDTQSSMQATENSVNEAKADITKLADELKESESSLQDAIKNINTTNRNTAYEVGDQIHSSYLPFNCYITCVTAGTTGDTLPVIPKGDHDSGFTYTDGTATFKMDYWPLSINGKKPLNKAGDITIDVDKVKGAEKADSATNASLISPFEISTVDMFRNVWFSDAIENGKACYNPNIQYNPSTNVLKVGTVQGTSTNADNATKWNGLSDDIRTENNTDTWLLVYAGDRIQHTDRTKMTVGNADTVDGYHASDLLSTIQDVLPKTEPGVGQFRQLVVNNSQVKLPDGGTWAYFVYVSNSWGGAANASDEHKTRTGAGIAAGGTVLHTDFNLKGDSIDTFKLSGTAPARGGGNNVVVGGFCWRIA